MNKLKNKRISKISEIEKVIKCKCNKGEVELRMIYVSPINGKVSLSYRHCSNSFCSYESGFLMFTDITIPELVLGE